MPEEESDEKPWANVISTDEEVDDGERLAMPLKDEAVEKIENTETSNETNVNKMDVSIVNGGLNKCAHNASGIDNDESGPCDSHPVLALKNDNESTAENEEIKESSLESDRKSKNEPLDTEVVNKSIERDDKEVENVNCKNLDEGAVSQKESPTLSEKVTPQKITIKNDHKVSESIVTKTPKDDEGTAKKGDVVYDSSGGSETLEASAAQEDDFQEIKNVTIGAHLILSEDAVIEKATPQNNTIESDHKVSESRVSGDPTKEDEGRVKKDDANKYNSAGLEAFEASAVQESDSQKDENDTIQANPILNDNAVNEKESPALADKETPHDIAIKSEAKENEGEVKKDVVDSSSSDGSQSLKAPAAQESSSPMRAFDKSIESQGDENSQMRTNFESKEDAVEEAETVENRNPLSSQEDEGKHGDAAQPSTPLRETKGAKIIIDRFSSWRKKANAAVSTNMGALSSSQQYQDFRMIASAALNRTKKEHEKTGENSDEVSIKANIPDTSLDVHPGENQSEGRGDNYLPIKETSHGEDTSEIEETDKSAHNHSLRAEGSPSAGDSHDTVVSHSRTALRSHSIVDDDDESSGVESRAGSSTFYEDSDYLASDYTDSGFSVDEARYRTAAASLYMRTAASVIKDSVATGFRGRYGEGADQPEKSNEERTEKSQTEKILSSRAAAHMQEILDTLDEKHEYVMLLGKGMLGVNLRQTYLKHHGVYVDYLVESGAAYNSKVVFPGDIIQKVGTASAQKGTIFTVPKMIAEARRPTVLIFSTGQSIDHSKINYIDLSIAMMHQLHGQTKSAISNMPLQEEYNTLEADTSEQEGKDEQEDSNFEDWKLEHHGLDDTNPVNVPAIPLGALESVEMHLAKRGTGLFSVAEMSSLAAKTGMDNFRISIRHAFVTCALDGRRLPFLSCFLSIFTSDEYELSHTADEQKTTASVELIFFLELTSFVELYDATPKSRRLDIAKRIAFKFLLPCKIGNRKEKPMFDFSHLCSDSELEKLRKKFSEEQGRELKTIQRSVFLSYQEAVAEKLCGAPFLAFLLSDECSRMRGYLRNTSPYRTVSTGDIFSHTIANEANINAANNLLYNIVFLLCQREREICGENDDIVGEKTNRVLGAAGGMCCAIFLKKCVLKLVESVNFDDVESGDNEVYPLLSSEVFDELKLVFVQAWDMFLSPEGGALQWTSTSNETDFYLTKTRNCIRKAQQEKQPKIRAQILSNLEMQQTLENLAENLLYDYSVGAYAKFREHPFHEWMCSEINISSDRTDDIENRIPKLSPGSITRLLRKARLPKGISAHKPSGVRTDKKSSIEINDSKGSGLLGQQNAHHAIIFGTDDGTGLIDRNCNPSLSQFDLRRYNCQQVSEPAKLCQVHPTIETYAFVPPRVKSPFSQPVDNKFVSADGWDISLIDFMIPGVQDESSEGGRTFGVSLVFQQSEQSFMEMWNKRTSTIAPVKLEYEIPSTKVESVPSPQENDGSGAPLVGENDKITDLSSFASPLSTFTSQGAPETAEASSVSGLLRVNMETPAFNEKLAGKPWSERIAQQRIALSTGAPITIGIVLVSSQNVIPAMRATLLYLIRDFSKIGNEESMEKCVCNPLIELLGNYSHLEVEAESISCILRPYMFMGSKPWLENPIATAQFHQYRKESGHRLLESLPLIPLMLLYITVLLEQKVVISSSRRSLLLSASTAITDLLGPLKWEHLVVPVAPSYLARDLLQYPAPFIVGLASEDGGNLDLLNSLPDDVSLVDLDVGRVILAPNIAFDENILEEHNEDKQGSIIQALRSQILYLAQTLGIAFGSHLSSNSWNADSPIFAVPDGENQDQFSAFEKLQSLSRSFLSELLAGSSSCSYWIEEHGQDVEKQIERTVLFDEDRFFQIKNLRANGQYSPLFEDGDGIGKFALNLGDFDLIIESFLRCQSFNSYLSTREKSSMAFF